MTLVIWGITLASPALVFKSAKQEQQSLWKACHGDTRQYFYSLVL